MRKLLKLIFLALLTSVLTGCGGGSASEEQPQKTDSPIDDVLIPNEEEVIKQLVDSVVSGLPYKSTSKNGSKELENRTTNLGQFITYKDGHTDFYIGNVNLGTWNESASSNTNEIVQLSDLSYDKNSKECASPNSITSARILLGVNEGGSDNYIQVGDDKELIGCPNDKKFYEENNLSVTEKEAIEHLDETSDRLEVYSTIASLLFNKDAKELNYNYNGYGAIKKDQSGCDGYKGGHAGVDFQTKSVAGDDKTANETVYSLTEGKVVLVDRDKGEVIIESKIKDETVIIVYLHLRDIHVTQGESYSKNTSIGIQGNRGLGFEETDTNPSEHVHVEIRSSSYRAPACGASTSYDPLEYFEAIIKEPSDVSLPDYLEGTYYARSNKLILKPDGIKEYTWINGSWKLNGEGRFIEAKEINASTSDVIIYDDLLEEYIKMRLEKEGSNLKCYWYEDNDTLEGARAATEYELDAIFSINPVDLTSLFDINSINNMLDILPPSEYFPTFNTSGTSPYLTNVRREYNHVENTDEFISYLISNKGFTLDTSRQSSEPDAIYYSNSGGDRVRVSDDGYNVLRIELNLSGGDYTKAKFEDVFAESRIQGEFSGIVIERHYNYEVSSYEATLEASGFTKYERSSDHYSERYKRENTGSIRGTVSEVWFQPDFGGSIIWNLEKW
ncbi:MAG: M23 family metallopeptidase [Campylobacteraceae bacterium]|jgi:murein DD-endopeptidase MepM/ murein hydrolase activator NlpD|nr:M23 family metallopeptidase [Campylobacteraceae bacterium]